MSTRTQRAGADTRNNVYRLVRRLISELGPPRVAELAGVGDEALVVSWQDVGAEPPDPEVQVRLLKAHTVLFGLVQELGEPQARQWMAQGNAVLAGDSPVAAIGADRFKEVARAAKLALEEAS